MLGNMRIGSLERNAIYSGITNFSDILLFVLMILAARFLGANDFGVFTFSLSLAIIFLTCANFGLNTLAVRDVARDRELAARYVGNILCWKGGLSLISFVALVATVFYIIESPREVRIVVSILGIAVMMRFFTMTCRAFLQAFERFDIESLAVVFEQLVLLITGACLLFLGYGLIAFSFAFLFARTLGCLFTFALLKKIVHFSVRFDRRFMVNLQIEAMPIGIALLAATAYLHIDTLILSRILTYTEVGLYNSAFKIYAGLFLLPSIISTVLFPRLSGAYLKNKIEHNGLLVRGILSLFLVSLPISIGGMVFSEEIILLVFGEGFIRATTTMQILLGVTTITFQIWLLRVFLISINREKALMNFNIIALCARIAFDLLLIPKYGIVGAAMATGASELLLFCGIWTYLLTKHFQLKSTSDFVRKALYIMKFKINEDKKSNILR